MPPAGALVGAVGSFFSATAFTIGSLSVTWGTVATLGLSSVLGFVQKRKMEKERERAARLNQGLLTTVRAPDNPREIVYGKTRKGGTLVFAETDGPDNVNLHLIVALAGHEVQGIDEVYFDDNLAIAANGTVQGDYVGKVDFVKLLGSPNQQSPSALREFINGVSVPEPVVVAASIARTKIPGLGTLTKNFTPSRNMEIDTVTPFLEREGFPREGVRVRIKQGATLLATSDIANPMDYNTSTFGFSTNIPDLALDSPVSMVSGTTYTIEIVALYDVPDYNSTGLYWRGAYQLQEVAVVNEEGLWTSEHRLQGIAALYVRLKWEQNFWNGIPNITAVVRGKKLLNPLNDVYQFSSNSGLCVLDYMTDPVLGLGIPLSEIDLEALDDALDSCHELVPKADGSNERRYNTDGVIFSDGNPADALETLLAAMGGTLAFAGGKYFIHAGVWRVPTLTLGASDVVEALQVVTATTAAEVFNQVQGRFSDPEQDYQIADFPVLQSDVLAARDGQDYGDPLVDGTLQVGTAYRIDAAVGTADFTGVGAASNATGTVFVATGTTPVWGERTEAWANNSFNAPIISIRVTGIDAGDAWGGRPDDDFRLELFREEFNGAENPSASYRLLFNEKRNVSKYSDPFDEQFNVVSYPGDRLRISLFNGWNNAFSVPVRIELTYATGAQRVIYAGESQTTMTQPTGTTDSGQFVTPDFEDYETHVDLVLPVEPAGQLTAKTMRRIPMDLDLPFTKSVTAAQRVAKIMLLEARQELVVAANCLLNERTWRMVPGENILVTLSSFGWNNKPFRVVESRLSAGEASGGTGLMVSLTLKETAEANFDWATSEEQQIDPAPNLP